ncbi:sugar transferase [Tenacibaculum ovolyticum]|uniref:sugar transferase n=1 Tax=Tenacibaculum ovolyticum TaxID=104270 RepID=UPI0007ECB4DC|nr:sugar transferase [Tenacibaculum ovolyticum]
MESFINRFIALIAILILSPVLIFVIIGILISDFGPIIYTAKRAGKNGKVLGVLKFRSMRVSNKKESKITSKNDSRIFGFGKFIRLIKVDELPQLFNILKGEMNIIGPRPEDLSIVQDHYDDIMKESLMVNPGLASPGSLYNYTHIEDSLNESNVEETYIKKILPLKVKIDVVYVRNKSFFYDLTIIMKTVIIIFQRSFGKKNFPLPNEYHLAKKL